MRLIRNMAEDILTHYTFVAVVLAKGNTAEPIQTRGDVI